MTDPTHTTSEQIALELGWVDIKGGLFGDPVGTPPLGSDKTLFMVVALGSGRYYLPDFEHDWEYAGPLLEELLAGPGVKLDTNENGDRFIEYGGRCPFAGNIYADTLTEAISHAWLVWKKENRDG